MTGSAGPPDLHGKGQLEREAAQWCVKMHGTDADLHRAEFEAWLRLGALHRYTYNRIEEVYVLSGRLIRTDRSAPAQETSEVPIFTARRSSAVVLVAALALAGTLVLSREAPPRAPMVPGASDAPSPVRLAASASPQQFRLSDGSIVALEAGSTLLVALGNAQRSLTLVSGGAEFRVAHEARPFTVTAAGGSITARGTRFVVAVAGASVDVRLIEGKIDVAYGASAGGPGIVRHLLAGEAIRYPAASAASPRPARSNEPAGQPATVGELVDRANASGDGSVRIEIADPALRAIAISGSFDVHDPATTADRLAAMLDLEARHPRPGVISLMKRAR